jgi:hypothetical protein
VVRRFPEPVVMLLYGEGCMVVYAGDGAVAAGIDCAGIVERVKLVCGGRGGGKEYYAEWRAV